MVYSTFETLEGSQEGTEGRNVQVGAEVETIGERCLLDCPL